MFFVNIAAARIPRQDSIFKFTIYGIRLVDANEQSSVIVNRICDAAFAIEIITVTDFNCTLITDKNADKN